MSLRAAATTQFRSHGLLLNPHCVKAAIGSQQHHVEAPDAGPFSIDIAASEERQWERSPKLALAEAARGNPVRASRKPM